jgi:hypothetical protein
MSRKTQFLAASIALVAAGAALAYAGAPKHRFMEFGGHWAYELNENFDDLWVEVNRLSRELESLRGAPGAALAGRTPTSGMSVTQIHKDQPPGTAESGTLFESSYSSGKSTLVFYLSGSATATKADQRVSIALVIDGSTAGEAGAFAGTAGQRLTFASAVVVEVGPGPHLIELRARPGTEVDANDRFSLVVMEIGG